MQLLVLLTDREGLTHKKADLEFDEQTTPRQLKETISIKLNIDPDSQDLFFGDGHEIIGIDLNSQLPQIGLKNLDTLIIKHANLIIWTEFNAFFDLAKKYVVKKQEHMAKENVKYTFERLKILNRSKFFIAYGRLGSRLRDFNENYASFLYTDDEQIKEAAEFYFPLFFKDDPQNPSIKIVFSPKPNSGAQGGLICSVKRFEKILGNYYLKTHLGLSSNTPSGHQTVDLRELLIYKLLHLLEMGPIVHFLTNVHSSRFGLCIATEEVPGFRTAAKIGMPTLESYKLDVLREIFYLIDLRSNNSNYGLNNNEKALHCRLPDWKPRKKY